MKLFISAACHKAKLFPATTLVFKTVRVGFPTAEIVVHGHALNIAHTRAVQQLCDEVGAEFYPLPQPLFHDEWIEKLAMTLNEPFWICDTDMVFFDKVEDWQFDQAYAGRFMPQFFEEWMQCVHRPRLMTCLQYFDPVKLRGQMRAWLEQFPRFPGNPIMEFFRQHFQPVRSRSGKVTNYFCDTTAGLYNALGGQKFTREQNACFEHLYAGSYVDIVAPHLTMATDLEANHRILCENPQMARGIQVEQQRYLKHFATKGG